MPEKASIITKKQKREAFIDGMRDGLPICLGYFAVSFSLGITAKNIGLDVFQAALVSFLNNASAGEYAGFTVIAADAPYLEMAIITLIANARYLLMSCALSQKTDSRMPLYRRLIIGHYVTDEIFAVAVSRKGNIDANYMYGVIALAAPGWTVGTALGALAGALMPSRLVSAFGVALYGMFLAVIIPKAKENGIIAGLVAVSFVLSFAASVLPAVSSLSEGTRTIILTVAISAVAALLFPVEDSNEEV